MSDEPVVVGGSDPWLGEPVAMDAPLEVKAGFFQPPALNTRVQGPGQAETGAAPAGPRTAVPGQHNWVPIGPRNVGGRLRDIAVDPQRSEIMYAAAAAGGVFKSLDGGDSWFPLWHDEPSLSMSAISICATDGRFVYAATGETQAGGGETIPAGGVLFSDDRGETWRSPDPGQAILAARIHAISAHPTNGQVCWAAAIDDRVSGGLYRTQDGGRTWHRFAARRGFADVRFARFPGNVLRLFVVPEGPVTTGPPERSEAFLVRIDNPDATDAALDLVLPARPAAPFDVAGNPDPLRLVGIPMSVAGAADPSLGKLAIFEGTAAPARDPVVFVAYTSDNYYGIFRIRDAHSAAAPTAMTFREIRPATTFATQGQGGYNIAFAVNPTDPNHLAFGMVELFVHRTANANNPPASAWLRAQMWDLYHLERGHHADHHALLFAPAPNAPFNRGVVGNAIVLWDANDGGLSWCDDWATAVTYPLSRPGDATTEADAILPVPDDAFHWVKRSHGITAVQMYDLTQHPRLNSVLGCGFQDNGVFVGSGGPSWQLVLTADGGFVAFDPDDPYRAITTIQTGVRETRFPGRLRDTTPVLGDVIQTALFPKQIDEGFRDVDAALFVAETAFHPRRPGRVFTSRLNRVYASRATTGDRWFPEPLGNGFEIIARPPNPQSGSFTVDVLDSAGGRAIGLMAQRRFEEFTPIVVRIVSLAREPYVLTAGLDVRLRFGIVPPAGPVPPPVAVTIPLTIGADLPAAPTSGQLAAYLSRQLRTQLAAQLAATRPDVEVLPLITATTRQVLIASANTGHANQVVLGGSALAALQAPARAFSGADAGAGGDPLPAIAPVGAFFERNADRVLRHRISVDLTGTALEVTRQNGTQRVDINCNTAFGADVGRVTPVLLARALRDALPAAHYRVWTTTAFLGVRLSSLVATTVALEGDLPTDLSTVFDTASNTVQVRADRVRRTFDDVIDLTIPTPPPPAPPVALPRTLRLREAANATGLQGLDAAFLQMAPADLSTVTMVELVHALRRLIDATAGVRLRCDLEIGPDGVSRDGEPSEIVFGPPGSTRAWIGDNVGRLYRSDDDGETWRGVVTPRAEAGADMEAIAVHPTNDRIVVVGTYREVPTGEMLMRSTDGGATWSPSTRPIIAAGVRLGVRALEFDPGSPEHLYAATDQGVFRSTDAGDHWDPFNEGLPNVRITDLALARETRMLRAGAWGRAVYERNLGGLDVKDVRLYLRSTVLDEGISQPGPGPDLFSPTPRSVRFDESPDIKLTRTNPRVGVLLDGVEFDDEVRTSEIRVNPAATEPGFVSVQVHNRGAFPAGTVQVTALWARADAGPPAVPVEVWAALGAPIAAGATFGEWTVIGDAAVTGPVAAIHNVVAAGAPRVVVFGEAPAFTWPAGLTGRVGVLAIVRSPDDPFSPVPTAPAAVLDLVRSAPKIAYRETAVVTAAVDDSVVLRSIDAVPFAVRAGTPPAQNGANGAAPLGLTAVAAPGGLDVRFTIGGPYNVTTRRRFTIAQTRTVTVNFAPDDPLLPNLTSVTNNEASAVIDRAVRLAGAPVRAVFGLTYPASGRHALRLITSGTATFTVAGTAAATLGLTAAAPIGTVTTPNASGGPWNLSAGAPLTLAITVTTTVAIVLGPGVREIPTPAVASALQVRAAINRQLRERGVLTITAEPIRRSLSVRRSATEVTTGRDEIGGLALADLVVAPNPVVGEPAQRALFDVVSAHGADRLTPGANNDLYLRSANTGNVAEPAVRHRLFLVDASASPLTFNQLGAAVPRAIPAERSTIVSFTPPIPALPSGSHQFVLCVADVDEAGQRIDVPPPAADLASLETLHAFCARTPGAAIREFLVT